MFPECNSLWPPIPLFPLFPLHRTFCPIVLWWISNRLSKFSSQVTLWSCPRNLSVHSPVPFPLGAVNDLLFYALHLYLVQTYSSSCCSLLPPKFKHPALSKFESNFSIWELYFLWQEMCMPGIHGIWPIINTVSGSCCYYCYYLVDLGKRV